MAETLHPSRTRAASKPAPVEKPKQTIASINKRIDEDAVQKFLAYLERGGGVWDKGHGGAATSSLMRPVNLATGKEYTGINVLHLGLLSEFNSNMWITGKQLDDLSKKMAAEGVPPEKLPRLRLGPDGKRPTPSIGVFSKSSSYEKKVTDPTTGEESTETRSSRINAEFRVYNADQIENCPTLAHAAAKDFVPIEAAEQVGRALIELTGLKVVHGVGNHYAPSTDTVHLIPREHFHDAYQYYSTANHEYIHSTLAETRLNRTDAIAKRWGDQAYAMEELRAEIGSLFLSIDLPGLTISDDHIKNHAAYVEHWRKALSKDPAELMRAFSDADKCVNYIRGRVHQYAEIHGLEPMIPAPRPEWTEAASAKKQVASVSATPARPEAAAADESAAKPARRSKKAVVEMGMAA